MFEIQMNKNISVKIPKVSKMCIQNIYDKIRIKGEGKILASKIYKIRIQAQENQMKTIFNLFKSI